MVERRDQLPHVKPFSIVILSAAALAALFAGACRDDRKPGESPPAPGGDTVAGYPVSRGASPGYVPDQACRQCHEELFDTYQTMGMARSFYPPTPDRIVETLDQPFFHQASNRYYVMTQRDDKLYLRRYCLDPAGEKFAELETEVAWIMGSNNHGRTYLAHDAHGTLFRLPVAWYRGKGWGMSPASTAPTTRDSSSKSTAAACSATTATRSCRSAPTNRTRSRPCPTTCPTASAASAVTVRAPSTSRWPAISAPATPKCGRASSTPAHFTHRQRDDLCQSCHLQPEVFLGEMMPRKFDRADALVPARRRPGRLHPVPRPRHRGAAQGAVPDQPPRLPAAPEQVLHR